VETDRDVEDFLDNPLEGMCFGESRLRASGSAADNPMGGRRPDLLADGFHPVQSNRSVLPANHCRINALDGVAWTG
jgi:hypothetical protein